MLRKSLSFAITLFFFYQPFLNAASLINTEDYPSGLVEMNDMIADHHATKAELKALKKEERQLLRFENLMVRLSKSSTSKSSGHAAGLFNDPVNRWFWLWLITWGAGILLLVVSAGTLTSPAIGIIWLLAFAVGSLALILWLVKKFG